uniref:ATG11 domain-containing protein n=1 Tax=Globodera pallida TaxID=36090 RepID=A0A183CLM9_GLOPA
MSISTESTNGWDITADQDSSEELRLSHDERIAELERDDEKIMKMKLKGLKEKMKNTKLELENKALRAELEHQKLLIAHNALQAKMEKYQEEQQHNIDAFTEAQKGNVEHFSRLLEKIDELERKQTADQKEHRAWVKSVEQMELELTKKMEQGQKQQQQSIDELQKIRAELEHQKLLIAHNALQAKMEKYQEQQQHNIDAFTEAQKGNVEQFSLLREMIDELERKQKADQKEHRACVESERVEQMELKLTKKMEQGQKQQQQTIDELQKTVVVLNDTIEKVSRSVLAERPIPKGNFGIFYYEVKLLEEKGDFHIGLTTKEMPLEKSVEMYKGTYAYASYATFWGHEVEGYGHAANGRPYIHGKPSFCVGDVKLPDWLSILPPFCFRAFRCVAMAPKWKQTLDQTSISKLPMAF